MYIKTRIPATHTSLAKYWLQFMLVVMAIFVSYSRVLDNRHHVVDVVVGAFLGAGIGGWSARGLIFPEVDQE